MNTTTYEEQVDFELEEIEQFLLDNEGTLLDNNTSRQALELVNQLFEKIESCLQPYQEELAELIHRYYEVNVGDNELLHLDELNREIDKIEEKYRIDKRLWEYIDKLFEFLQRKPI